MEENIKLHSKQASKRYDNLNGLRTIGALLIPFMHVFTNSQYKINNSMLVNVIMSFAHLVCLFFIMSAFGMCCGYYKKIKEGTISVEKFYLKRYKKLFPFFSFLVILDFIVGKGKDSIFEVFANLTMAFGLLPNSKITVIGVGWTLGVIFAFYMLFPFFVFALNTKKRAWFSFFISLVLSYSCEYYFLADGLPVGCNFLRWSCYFVVGGLIYLYRDQISDFLGNKRLVMLIVCCLITVAWYYIPNEYGMNIIKTLIVFSVWTIYAIAVKSKVLNNKITKFFSDISFEIYLSHMVIFRVIEKLGLVHLSSNDLVSYLILTVLVICLDIIFVVIAKKVLDGFMEELTNKRQTKVGSLNS